MGGKLSDVEKRIGTVHQLDAVISAMRGIAAARVHEARGRLDGVRAYASVVGAAIGEALALASQTADTEAPSRGSGGHIVIVLCAEQGFAGSFSQRVLDKAVQVLKTGSAELFLVGDRGAMIARERNLSFGWSAPMVVHADEAPALANRITDALYDRLQAGHARRVTSVYASPGPSGVIEIVEQALLPFDFTRFHVRPTAIPPIVTLPPEQLLAELADEYVYAELCEAVMPSYAAENKARMQAMIASSQQRGKQARRARWSLSKPAPGRNHGRDHGAFRRNRLDRAGQVQARPQRMRSGREHKCNRSESSGPERSASSGVLPAPSTHMSHCRTMRTCSEMCWAAAYCTWSICAALSGGSATLPSVRGDRRSRPPELPAAGPHWPVPDLEVECEQGLPYVDGSRREGVVRRSAKVRGPPHLVGVFDIRRA